MKDNKIDSMEETENKKNKWVDNILEKFGIERYLEEFEDEEDDDDVPQVQPEPENEKPEIKKEPAKTVSSLKKENKKETIKPEIKENKYPKSTAETTNKTNNPGGNMNNYEETSARMRVFTPAEVSEVREVCDELRKGYAVVVNTDNLTEADYCRFYDFVYGAAYMIDGKVSQISDTVLILTPANIDISSAVREEEPEEEITEENITEEFIGPEEVEVEEIDEIDF